MKDLNSLVLNDFRNMLELSLNDLSRFSFDSNQDDQLKNYQIVILAFLQHDLPKLEFYQNQIAIASRKNPTDFYQFLLLASNLRLHIRLYKNSEELIKQCTQFLTTSLLPNEFQGELHFLLGMIYEAFKLNQLCFDHNNQAFCLFQKSNLKRRSLLSLQNKIAAQSRLFPHKNLLIDYYQVYRLARSQKIRSVAGIALMNISREFQIMGALYKALNSINKSLLLLTGDEGTKQYFLALLNRSHILIDLGNLQRAKVDYEMARFSEFPEIQSAANTLSHYFNENPNPEYPDNLQNASWEERHQDLYLLNRYTKPLSVKEDEVIRILANGSLAKTNLMDQLFGDNLDTETKENRLKSLLKRIHLKRPGLVLYIDKKYQLSNNLKNTIAS